MAKTVKCILLILLALTISIVCVVVSGPLLMHYFSMNAVSGTCKYRFNSYLVTQSFSNQPFSLTSLCEISNSTNFEVVVFLPAICHPQVLQIAVLVLLSTV